MIKPGITVNTECSLAFVVDFPPLGFTEPPIPKRWEHDCKQCHYLGSRIIEEQHYDFYKCNFGTGLIKTVSYIARYGSEPCENLSYPSCALQALPDDTGDLVLEIMKTEQEINKSAHRGKYRFAVNTRENQLNIIVSPLVSDKMFIYIHDALKAIEPQILYEPITPMLLAKAVSLTDSLVHKQIAENR